MNTVLPVASIRWSDHAFTLLEVMVSLAILASIIVAIATIRGRLLRQLQHAEVVTKANVLAGRLTGQWRSGIVGCDVGQQCSGRDEEFGYRWQLQCTQVEESGVFLKRLQVVVYGDESTAEPTVNLSAWVPIR